MQKIVHLENVFDMKRHETFSISTLSGVINDVEIISSFKLNGRIFVLHKYWPYQEDLIKYVVSDFLTGCRIGEEHKSKKKQYVLQKV